MGVIVTLGIVFGDIGTSPLYVMKAIVRAGNPVNAEYIIGAVSCIIWTLTLQTTVKYVLIALRADNKGEGGILALYALIRRHSRKWFYFLAIIGASTLIADGVITPSITVLSAIEGLKVYEPETPSCTYCPLYCYCFVLHSAIRNEYDWQVVWSINALMFSMLGVLGAMHIGDYIPILQAFNPLHAIRLLTSNPEWFLILGAVFLCTTGAEALYSDLGHCGINNIRTSWAFVKIMLILNYLGQGAWIIAHVDNLTSGLNPFYAIMPHGMLFFGIVMATIAAIIASQALISGSFTIFSEAMNLKFWPRQKIKYPTDVKGQLYIPFVNMSLFILCVIVILFFQSSERMEAAYGLSITITMLMTTFLLSAYLTIRRVNRWLTLLFLIVFVGLESIFFVANMAKFMNGGWVTMLLASVMIAIMYVWYNATTIRNSQIQIRDVRESFSIISDIKNDESIPKYATNIVYLTKLGGKYDIEQKILYSIINKHPMRADHYFLLHIDYQDSPSTLEYDVTTLVPDTLYRINLRLGFRIHPLVNRYFRQIIEDMVAKNEFSLASSYPSLAKHNVMGNFVFVLINRIYSTFASFSFKERLIMDAYEWIDHLKLSMTRSLGLNTSNVLIENVPLTLKSHAKKVGNSIPRVERIEENEGFH